MGAPTTPTSRARGDRAATAIGVSARASRAGSSRRRRQQPGPAAQRPRPPFRTPAPAATSTRRRSRASCAPRTARSRRRTPVKSRLPERRPRGRPRATTGQTDANAWWSWRLGSTTRATAAGTQGITGFYRVRIRCARTHECPRSQRFRAETRDCRVSSGARGRRFNSCRARSGIACM
jgi:hypothetical protein